MTEYLVIRLGRNADDLSHWIVVDSSGARHSPPVAGMLAESRADLHDRAVIVLVPSEDVLTTTVDIPVKGSKLQSALPYALEEFLAEDVDHLHFAAGVKRSSGRTPVCVVSRERMNDWLSRLDAAGIVPDSLMAESHGLARIPGTISMLLDQDTIFVNDGSDVELVMQGVGPGDALAAIGALDDDPPDEDEAESTNRLPRHVLAYCEPGDDKRFQHDWIAIRHELDSLDVKLLPDGITPKLAVTVATGSGINLLQGQYAPKREYGNLFQPWKYAAALAGIFVLVSIGAKAVDYYVMSARAEELRETFNAEYQSMLPGAPETSDPLAVVESLRRRIGNTGTSPVFLQSMGQLAVAVQRNDKAKVQAVSYRAGVIDVRVSAPDVATLDTVRQAIVEGGQFRADIQSTDADGDNVSSRIQIRETGR